LAGALPQTPLGGAYTALPRPLSWIWSRFAAGEGLGWGIVGKGEGSEGEVDGREREGPQVTVEPFNQGPS